MQQLCVCVVAGSDNVVAGALQAAAWVLSRQCFALLNVKQSHGGLRGESHKHVPEATAQSRHLVPS